MREGISPVKPFDVSDMEAEMAAEKKKKPEAAGLMARIKEKLSRGSKPEIKTAREISDQEKLAETRKKIAEGTGEIELSEEDLEEVKEEN